MSAAEVIDLTPLNACRSTFRRWFGEAYDLDPLFVCLAARAVGQMDGEPLWVMVVGGSGTGKTEIVSACAEDSLEAAEISPAALLSGTPASERAADATGGLLRELGDRGTLVVKDFTSVLDTPRDTRARTLAALREIYDGRWVRRLGVDGGKSLEWQGRLTFMGAVTTAWDTHHSVIAKMGERFVLIRVPTGNRDAFARQAYLNSGHEARMRDDLRRSASSVLASADLAAKPDFEDVLWRIAGLVALVRTAVEFDHGEVSQFHDPEGPGRLTKQLAQLARGAVAIGMPDVEALRLVRRVARDSLPPLRLSILRDLGSRATAQTIEQVTARHKVSRATIRRQIQALDGLGLLDTFGGRSINDRAYAIGPKVDLSLLGV